MYLPINTWEERAGRRGRREEEKKKNRDKEEKENRERKKKTREETGRTVIAIIIHRNLPRRRHKNRLEPLSIAAPPPTEAEEKPNQNRGKKKQGNPRSLQFCHLLRHQQLRSSTSTTANSTVSHHR
jgi:hypothetical protein